MNATALLMTAGAVSVLPEEVSIRRLRALTTASESTRVRMRPEIPALVTVLASMALLAWWAGGMPAVVAAVIVGATLYKRHRDRRTETMRETELDAVLSGLEVLTAELEVGAHPASACASAAEECDGRVAEAFRAAAARARLGGSAAGGFEQPESPVNVELSRIANVWTIAEFRGLALAELLGAVRTDLLGRKRFRKRTEAGLAGARATAAVLAGLPLLGVGLGQLMGASPLHILLGGGLGGGMLIAGSMFLCAGLLWTDRIVAAVTR